MEAPTNQQEVLAFLKTCSTHKFVKSELIDSESPFVLAPPTLWKLTEGKYRYWEIYMAIAPQREAPDVPAAKLDLLEITDGFMNRAPLPKGACGIFWTRSGLEGTENPIISSITYIEDGKNLRGSNYTTPFTQVVLDVQSLYTDKIHEGASQNRTQLITQQNVTFPQLIRRERQDPEVPQWRVFGMAIHDFTKQSKHIHYPCYVDPKYDGTMCIVVHHPELPKRAFHVLRDGKPKLLNLTADIYSRGRTDIVSQDHIVDELYPVLRQYPGLHIVGELWRLGRSLQDISGDARRVKDSSRGAAAKLQLHVFDCFHVADPLSGYDDRQITLDGIFEELDELEPPAGKENYVIRVPTERCSNKSEVEAKFRGYVDQGLEGAVVRNHDALYEFGITKEIRSYDTLKLKPRPDDEWPVVSYKDGKGKNAGLVIWICAESDKCVLMRAGTLVPLKDRLTFSVTPNQPNALRQHIYSKIGRGDYFEKHIYGKLVTVSYLTLSKDKYIPTQPKMLRFRDPSVDRELREGF